jgi:hypothetical protein
MRFRAASSLSLEIESMTAARRAAEAAAEQLGSVEPALVLVYGTIYHAQPVLLDSVRAVFGPRPLVAGCSSQGVATNGRLTEQGYGVGVMGIGGTALSAFVAVERELSQNPREKGRRLAHSLKLQAGGEPQIVVVLFDASSGSHAQELLGGMTSALACPIVGGGASLSWGLPGPTYQYFDTQAMQRSAVGIALGGSVHAEIGIGHGTVPTGPLMTVTRTEGSRILELDGRRAADVFRECAGQLRAAVLPQQTLTSWAIGIERTLTVAGPHGPEERAEYVIRAATGIDYETGAVTVHAGVAEGTRVMLHHRTVDAVLEGTREMGSALLARFAARQPRAILGFECRARTVPFLGPERTRVEHNELCSGLGAAFPWLGMMSWGQIAPLGKQPALHTYSYPLAVLFDRPRDASSAPPRRAAQE